MTIVYLVAVPATALIAVVSFLVGATAIGFVFPLLWAGACFWQLNGGKRNIGH